jgi:hypothetical protein
LGPVEVFYGLFHRTPTLVKLDQILKFSASFTSLGSLVAALYIKNLVKYANQIKDLQFFFTSVLDLWMDEPSISIIKKKNLENIKLRFSVIRSISHQPSASQGIFP